MLIFKKFKILICKKQEILIYNIKLLIYKIVLIFNKNQYKKWYIMKIIYKKAKI